ncbi:hypothetical protein [Olivibacter sitiensis]|uniref:hypothetical protein n=1 Tax=Olivibacter sitiensis TaxID=376470 RepID=UPI0003F4C308|nr:hypothetical protein [Olivibacter sitiensis]
MSLSYNERLFQVYDYLKKHNKIKTYVAFGGIIGENKAGVNDLKNDRKKATIEHFNKLKISYPELNGDFLIGVSDILVLSDGGTDTAQQTVDAPSEQEAIIAALRETIASKNETIAALKSLLEGKS